MTKATKSKVARIVKNAETKRESIIKAQSEMLSALAKTVFVLTKSRRTKSKDGPIKTAPTRLHSDGRAHT